MDYHGMAMEDRGIAMDNHGFVTDMSMALPRVTMTTPRYFRVGSWRCHRMTTEMLMVARGIVHGRSCHCYGIDMA